MQDLSLHILDVAENGVTAGATLVRITVVEDLAADRLTVEIGDNGPGMDPAFAAKVLDPFVTTRTTRKVGMGLSLFQQAAQAAEGDLEIDSSPGVGTTVKVFMKHSHIDRKPMGNLAETFYHADSGQPGCGLCVRSSEKRKRIPPGYQGSPIGTGRRTPRQSGRYRPDPRKPGEWTARGCSPLGKLIPRMEH